MLHGVLWNLFLAALPLVLGLASWWALGGKEKKARLPAWVTLPLLAAWLAFLPNTCYLLTEWRHLLYDEHWAPLLEAGQQDSASMLATAKWAGFFAVYSGLGLLLFTLAIRPIELRLRMAGVRPLLWGPPLFFLMSLGVYLGLRPRLNSWDLVTQPLRVLDVVMAALSTPPLLMAILAFAAVLWVLYEIVDIWVDGAAERLRRWHVLPNDTSGRSR